MSFYQNVIDTEFRGSFPLDDRQLSPTWKVKANVNRSNYMVAWNNEPYDFSTYNMLNINFAYDVNLVNYSTISIDVAGTIPSATLAVEVCAALNANTTFSDLFVANPYNFGKNGAFQGPPFSVLITGKRNKTSLRAYISNPGAEQIMGFNAKASVSQMPSYFTKHTIANRFTSPQPTDSVLILLDPTDGTVDEPIIEAAGFVPGDMLADWQLMAGTSTVFRFKKQTVDGSDRVTKIIDYPAGASPGDLAVETQFTYTSANTTPTTIIQIPYILQSGDLITPS